MSGYKTFIFGLLVVLLGQVGVHVAPDALQRWGDVIFSVIGLAIIALRMVTSTPIFDRVGANVGLSAADVAALKADILAALPDTGGIASALTDLSAKIDVALTPPAPAAPAPLTPGAAS